MPPLALEAGSPNLPNTTELFLQVALDNPLRRLFDYLPPADMPCPPQPGMRVEVPFGRGSQLGVIARISATSQVPTDKLRRASRLLDEEPILDTETLELIEFAADYYQASLGESFAAAMPVLLRQGRSLWPSHTCWRLASNQGSPRRLGSQQRIILERLGDGRHLTEDDLDELGPTAKASARLLTDRGILESYVEQARSQLEPATLPVPGPALNLDQTAAVNTIGGHLGEYACFLLHGVTGSGKTEVYLQAIAQALARGTQALVLVPEIGLTPQSIARFKSRLGVPLAVLHSGMTDSERLHMWRAARQGTAQVIIGTRSAVFAPLPRPGIIIIDEEHDASYKQQEGFRYSARDLAVWRARRLSIPVVLGSATPMLESLANVEAGRYVQLNLPTRAGSAGKPSISLVDLRTNPSRQGLSTPSVIAMERHLKAGGQVLLYLNRRGFAPTLFCPGCAWVAPCPHCDARLTVHGHRQQLLCHHCGTQSPLPFACPQCENELLPMGQGTERIEDTLATVFPDITAVRVDRDTVRARGDIDRVLERVRSGEARILVGTQMLTKGHDFPDVSLVIVINADQGLFGTDFRTAERLAQTIVQVSGRAGRASRPGEVLIQTSCPEHPLLQQLLTDGYEGFAKAAMAEREAARWPPYSRLALLRVEAADAATAMAFLNAARALAEQAGHPGVRLLGPAPAAMERRAGRYRAQLLLEAADRSRLKQLLDPWALKLEALPQARRVRWSLDIDPIEIT